LLRTWTGTVATSGSGLHGLDLAAEFSTNADGAIADKGQTFSATFPRDRSYETPFRPKSFGANFYLSITDQRSSKNDL
jgi:hypothetical protein